MGNEVIYSICVLSLSFLALGLSLYGAFNERGRIALIGQLLAVFVLFFATVYRILLAVFF